MRYAPGGGLISAHRGTAQGRRLCSSQSVAPSGRSIASTHPLDRHRPIRRPAVRQLDRQAHARIVGERPNDHVLMAFHWLADFFELARIQQVNDTVNTVGDNLTKP